MMTGHQEGQSVLALVTVLEKLAAMICRLVKGDGVLTTWGPKNVLFVVIL